MANPYQILVEFLEACQRSPELAAPFLQLDPALQPSPDAPELEPPVEIANNLRRFARGELPDQERHELCALLDTHPVWLSWLAQQVRELRPPEIER